MISYLDGALLVNMDVHTAASHVGPPGLLVDVVDAIASPLVHLETTSGNPVEHFLDLVLGRVTVRLSIPQAEEIVRIMTFDRMIADEMFAEAASRFLDE